MAGVMKEMRFGDLEVLVEAVSVPGTERTSTGTGPSAGRMVDALERARAVINAAASSTANTVRELGDKTRPDRLEVEFGVGFSAKGDIIVASGSANMTLKVKLIYDAHTVEATEDTSADDSLPLSS
ncbi:CU044_2847 family protein [Nocardia sp. NPDC058633]|uniref:CU044_2847 family protein n=1 Tax=Nocardia sp. NPDC058633 TaxID=3346568 RepID=UPI00366462AE